MHTTAPVMAPLFIYIFASDYTLISLLSVAYCKESQDLSLVNTHILTTYKLLVTSLKVSRHYSGQPQWISTGRLLSSYFSAHLTQLVCDYFRSHTDSAAKEHLLHHPLYPSATAYSHLLSYFLITSLSAQRVTFFGLSSMLC